MSIQSFLSKDEELFSLEAKINLILEKKPSSVEFEDVEDTKEIYGFEVSVGHRDGEKYSCIRFKLEEELTRDEKEKLIDEGFSLIVNDLLVINKDNEATTGVCAYGLPFNGADKQKRIRAYLKKVELHYQKEGKGLHLNIGVQEAQANVDEIEKEMRTLNEERMGKKRARYQISEGHATIYNVAKEYLKMEREGIKKGEERRANKQKQSTLSSAEIIEIIRGQIPAGEEYFVPLIARIVNKKAVIGDLNPIAEKQESDRTEVLNDLRAVFKNTSYFISTIEDPMNPDSVEHRKIIMKNYQNR